MRRIPLTAAAMAFLALPGVALAGSDVSRTLQFLGFNADGTKYLLKVSDADTGDFLSLRNFATAKQEKAIPIEAKKQEKKLVEDAKKQFKIVDKGKEDMASPDGRFTFSGMGPERQEYRSDPAPEARRRKRRRRRRGPSL